jgi:nucleoside-diphosphate-sugar epimerase
VPAWLGRSFSGEHLLTAVRAASNAKAGRELGWQPAHPSWRQGIAEVASRATAQQGREMAAKSWGQV